MKVKIVCPRCGSDDVTKDAAARWSVENQSWDLTGVFDATTCESCGHESDLDFQEKPVGDHEQHAETIVVVGNYGRLTCDAQSGVVISYEPRESDHREYSNIARVDVDEWRRTYPGEHITQAHIDICDMGYWTSDYTAPEENYRNGADSGL